MRSKGNQVVETNNGVLVRGVMVHVSLGGCVKHAVASRVPEDPCQAWGTPQAPRVLRGMCVCGRGSGFAEVEGSLPGTGCAFNLPRLRAHCQGAAATQAMPRLRAHCSVVRDRAQHRSLGCSVDRDCARLRQLQLTGTGSVDRVWAMVPFAVDSTDERPTTRGIRYKAWSVCRKLAATQALPRLRVHCRGPAAL